jgi:hypothetical protein
MRSLFGVLVCALAVFGLGCGQYPSPSVTDASGAPVDGLTAKAPDHDPGSVKRMFYTYGGDCVTATVTVTASDGDHTGTTDDHCRVVFELPRSDDFLRVRITAPGFCPVDKVVEVKSGPVWNWFRLVAGC